MAKKDTDFEKKAKEIKSKIFSNVENLDIEKSIKEITNESMRYALQHVLSKQWVSATQKKAFLEILKEQKDAINLLFFTGENKGKAIQILKPLFGNNSKKFINEFQNTFDKMQRELLSYLEKPTAN
jgi:hypothetical protein